MISLARLVQILDREGWVLKHRMGGLDIYEHAQFPLRQMTIVRSLQAPDYQESIEKTVMKLAGLGHIQDGDFNPPQ